jgi:twitching motility two-component system response regulator PilG
MPGMDGYQLCRLLRQNADTTNIPIILLSGKDGFFSKVRGRMAGSTEYITKPFQPEGLLRVVERYCALEEPTGPIAGWAVRSPHVH